jgi:hypothetical protein
MKRKLLAGVLGLFVVIQLFRPTLNSSVSGPFEGKNDITRLRPPSLEVRRILESSCYDCHSNRTRYPWYAHVQPVAWWLENHIRDGKKHLNFSEFESYSTKRKMKKLEALCDEVRDREMPLKSYTWLHRGAKLNDAEIKALCDWAEAVQDMTVEK